MLDLRAELGRKCCFLETRKSFEKGSQKYHLDLALELKLHIIHYQTLYYIVTRLLLLQSFYQKIYASLT